MMETFVCPVCGEEYDDYPVMSQKYGTEICPDCSTKEALREAGASEKEIAEIMDAKESVYSSTARHGI